MAREIWKYKLEVADVQRIEMPKEAEILCVQIQGIQPCFWAMVDPTREKEIRLVYVVGTGQDISHLAGFHYVGTFQLLGGRLVYHVFDAGR